ncbi:hypothetical protein C8R45DRAFT_921654 [Mycena sanguinolenta]|nr:hypothetical protein C8R45DRAFT_921654 [Mycena sanguinolenta]
MQYTVDAEDFVSSWNLMISLFSQTAVSLVLYGQSASAFGLVVDWRTGIYFALFLLSIYTLSHRSKANGITFLIIASCVMAVLATTQMAAIVAAALLNARFVQQIVSAEAVIQPGILLTLSRVLHRCYVVWRFQWKITILPMVLITSTFVAGILWAAPVTHITDVRIAYGLGAVTNLILTASTAGRILWIQRVTARAGLANTVRKHSRVAIGIILESGAIYCIGTIFLAISGSYQYQSESISTFHYVAIGIAGQLTSIIPTFTVVYVGLKNTLDENNVFESRRTVSSNQMSNGVQNSSSLKLNNWELHAPIWASGQDTSPSEIE